MKIQTSRFRVGKREDFSLSKTPTMIASFYRDREEYEERLRANIKRIHDLQDVLYAHDRYSVLIILQAMDTAGKDGVIKHVFSGLNPQGTQVFNFKKPSSEELDHDFMWRSTIRLPERGRIGIFNRSYYEEVLITRVHPEVLFNQRIPREFLQDNKGIWRERYRDIVNFEDYLRRNGTKIIKFFLHISKDEQRQRLLDRIAEEGKNWKFELQDVEERKLWKNYMFAYHSCIRHTATDINPWHVIPADDKKNARLIVSQVLLEELQGLKMEYPKVDQGRKNVLKRIRMDLENGSRTRRA